MPRQRYFNLYQYYAFEMSAQKEKWPILRLIKKTFQFMNVVNGVSRSHNTANIPDNWNVYIGLRDAFTRQFT